MPPSGKFYRKKVAELEAKIEETEKKIPIAVKEAIAKERIKGKKWILAYRKQLRVAAKKRYADWMRVMNSRIRKLAHKKATTRLQNKRLSSTSYIDGVLAYPVIMTYCKKNNVSPTEMVYIILVCVVKKITLADCEMFGLAGYKGSYGILTNLCDYGLIEKFQDEKGINQYFPSVKGLAWFKAFKIYYSTYVKNALGDERYQRKANKW